MWFLQISEYSGDAGDSLSSHNGKPFSTYDFDNDARANGNCASAFKGEQLYFILLFSHFPSVVSVRNIDIMPF